MHQKETLEEICKLIKAVDPSGDSIRQANMFKTISELFHKTIKDDKPFSEIFDLFNARALEDEEFILSLVCVITSRQLDSFTVNGKVLRHGMLSILQKNFQNADNFKRDNMKKFYNSIKLLGEYFNKARLSNGAAINIIGQSMLNLINVELEKELRNICHLKGDEFARLILSQIALNGNLLKTRHKTEIEQVLLTIRKCNIELPSLSPKNRAFFHMTLDLYYSNYTNVGDMLEKVYKSYLLEDIGAGTIAAPIENGVIPTENGTMQSSLEKLSITKNNEEVRRPNGPAKNLKLQIKKQEPFRTGPMSPQRTPYRDYSLPRSPQKTTVHSRFYSPSPSTRNPPQSPSNRYQPQSPANKFKPRFSSSPSRNFPQRTASPTRNSPSNKFRPQYSSSPTRNPSQRSASQPPSKKLSPQELRTKNSPQSANQEKEKHNKASRSASAIRSPKVQSTKNRFDAEPKPESSHQTQNGTDDNVLRQQNSRSSTPTSTVVPAKYKINNSKVYFREENVENLTWHGDDGSGEGPDESTSPKVNPYSSSFLNFLSSN